MKKISTGVFIVIYLLLNYTNSNSQGIKVDFLGFNGVAQNYGTPLFWGIGYEQNFGEKISLGLTYRSGYSFDSENSYSDVEYGFSIPNGNVSFTVFQNCSWSEFAYTSKYFFSDNSDGSYYVASGISMMQTTVQYELNNLPERWFFWRVLAVTEYREQCRVTFRAFVLLILAADFPEKILKLAEQV